MWKTSQVPQDSEDSLWASVTHSELPDAAVVPLSSAAFGSQQLATTQQQDRQGSTASQTRAGNELQGVFLQVSKFAGRDISLPLTVPASAGQISELEPYHGDPPVSRQGRNTFRTQSVSETPLPAGTQAAWPAIRHVPSQFTLPHTSQDLAQAADNPGLPRTSWQSVGDTVRIQLIGCPRNTLQQASCTDTRDSRPPWLQDVHLPDDVDAPHTRPASRPAYILRHQETRSYKLDPSADQGFAQDTQPISRGSDGSERTSASAPGPAAGLQLSQGEPHKLDVVRAQARTPPPALPLFHCPYEQGFSTKYKGTDTSAQQATRHYHAAQSTGCDRGLSVSLASTGSAEIEGEREDVHVKEDSHMLYDMPINKISYWQEPPSSTEQANVDDGQATRARIVAEEGLESGLLVRCNDLEGQFDIVKLVILCRGGAKCLQQHEDAIECCVSDFAQHHAGPNPSWRTRVHIIQDGKPVGRLSDWMEHHGIKLSKGRRKGLSPYSRKRQPGGQGTRQPANKKLDTHPATSMGPGTSADNSLGRAENSVQRVGSVVMAMTPMAGREAMIESEGMGQPGHAVCDDGEVAGQVAEHAWGQPVRAAHQQGCHTAVNTSYTTMPFWQQQSMTIKGPTAQSDEHHILPYSKQGSVGGQSIHPNIKLESHDQVFKLAPNPRVQSAHVQPPTSFQMRHQLFAAHESLADRNSTYTQHGSAPTTQVRQLPSRPHASFPSSPVISRLPARFLSQGQQLWMDVEASECDMVHSLSAGRQTNNLGMRSFLSGKPEQFAVVLDQLEQDLDQDQEDVELQIGTWHSHHDSMLAQHSKQKYFHQYHTHQVECLFEKPDLHQKSRGRSELEPGEHQNQSAAKQGGQAGSGMQTWNQDGHYSLTSFMQPQQGKPWQQGTNQYSQHKTVQQPSTSMYPASASLPAGRLHVQTEQKGRPLLQQQPQQRASSEHNRQSDRLQWQQEQQHGMQLDAEHMYQAGMTGNASASKHDAQHQQGFAECRSSYQQLLSSFSQGDDVELSGLAEALQAPTPESFNLAALESISSLLGQDPTAVDSCPNDQVAVSSAPPAMLYDALETQQPLQRADSTADKLLPASSACVQLPTSSAYMQLPASSAYAQLPASSAYAQVPASSAHTQLPASLAPTPQLQRSMSGAHHAQLQLSAPSMHEQLLHPPPPAHAAPMSAAQQHVPASHALPHKHPKQPQHSALHQDSGTASQLEFLRTHLSQGLLTWVGMLSISDRPMPACHLPSAQHIAAAHGVIRLMAIALTSLGMTQHASNALSLVQTEHHFPETLMDGNVSMQSTQDQLASIREGSLPVSFLQLVHKFQAFASRPGWLATLGTATVDMLTQLLTAATSSMPTADDSPTLSASGATPASISHAFHHSSPDCSTGPCGAHIFQHPNTLHLLKLLATPSHSQGHTDPLAVHDTSSFAPGRTGSTSREAGVASLGRRSSPDQNMRQPDLARAGAAELQLAVLSCQHNTMMVEASSHGPWVWNPCVDPVVSHLAQIHAAVSCDPPTAQGMLLVEKVLQLLPAVANCYSQMQMERLGSDLSTIDATAAANTMAVAHEGTAPQAVASAPSGTAAGAVAKGSTTSGGSSAEHAQHSDIVRTSGSPLGTEGYCTLTQVLEWLHASLKASVSNALEPLHRYCQLAAAPSPTSKSDCQTYHGLVRSAHQFLELWLLQLDLQPALVVESLGPAVGYTSADEGRRSNQHELASHADQQASTYQQMDEEADGQLPHPMKHSYYMTGSQLQQQSGPLQITSGMQQQAAHSPQHPYNDEHQVHGRSSHLPAMSQPLPPALRRQLSHRMSLKPFQSNVSTAAPILRAIVTQHGELLHPSQLQRQGSLLNKQASLHQANTASPLARQGSLKQSVSLPTMQHQGSLQPGTFVSDLWTHDSLPASITSMQSDPYPTPPSLGYQAAMQTNYQPFINHSSMQMAEQPTMHQVQLQAPRQRVLSHEASTAQPPTHPQPPAGHRIMARQASLQSPSALAGDHANRRHVELMEFGHDQFAASPAAIGPGSARHQLASRDSGSLLPHQYMALEAFMEATHTALEELHDGSDAIFLALCKEQVLQATQLLKQHQHQ